MNLSTACNLFVNIGMFVLYRFLYDLMILWFKNIKKCLFEFNEIQSFDSNPTGRGAVISNLGKKLSLTYIVTCWLI